MTTVAPARSVPNRQTGYCRTLGIISATRAPLPPPMPCSHAPNAADSVSSSANVIDLPMQVNEGRDAYFEALSSKMSRSDAYSLTSISAGTPGGYCLSQIFSTSILPRGGPSGRAPVPCRAARAAGVSPGDARGTILHRNPAAPARAAPCRQRLAA